MYPSKIMEYHQRHCPFCETTTKQRFVSRDGKTVAWKCRTCGNEIAVEDNKKK